ncbi:MAG: hypothetical protein AAF632_26920 [Bacteroidota bacterium]
MKKLFYSFSLTLIVIVTGCREEEILPQESNSPISINGYVQKGPFVNGTTITLSELDEKLIPTGKNFPTQIADNRGSFSLKDIELESEFVQLQAEGFYFDEVKGKKSAAQLTLFALANISNIGSINVNLLSHLERNRVVYLIQEEELSFTTAKVQAQREILSAFGIVSDSIGYSEQLDISQDGDQNAILLAISAILQSSNSVAELSELSGNFITDLREDGIVNSEAIQTRLEEQAKSLDLPQIRRNLEDRYAEMGIEATIPNFEQYIDSDGDGILNKDEDDTPEDFTFETQVDVAVNDTITSNAITISGLKGGGIAVASVTNGWPVVNSSVVNQPTADVSIAELKNGDELQIQLVSSAEFADTTTATITIGTLSRSFSIVTDNYLPDAFNFSPLTDVAVDSLYTSDTITISGLPYSTSTSITNGILIKNDEVISSDSVTVKNGDQLAIQLRSSPEVETTASASLEINGVIGNFTVTTDDYSPDPFTFKSIENAKRNTVYQSDTITITGLPHPTPPGFAWFSASGQWADNPDPAKLYVNGAIAPGNGDLSLVNGDQIYIELLSSDEYEIASHASLTITDRSANFDITAGISPWQRKANFPHDDYDFGSSPRVGFTTSSHIYIITESGNLLEYSPDFNQWTTRAKYPGSGIRKASGFSLNGKGYVCLGTDTSDYSTLHNELWEYNPIVNSWQKLTSFPGSSRKFQTAFTVDGKAYLGLGEIGNDADEEGIPSKDLWQYDPTADTWQQMSNFPGEARTGAFAMPFQNNILLGSGWSESIAWEHAYFNLFSDLWEYKYSSDTWVKKNDINFLPEGAFVLGGKDYIYCEESYPYETSGIYQYDALQDKWVFIEQSLRELFGGYGRMYFSLNNKAYVYTSHKGFWEFTPPQE